jgi:HK97 family phage prohead protease
VIGLEGIMEQDFNFYIPLQKQAGDWLSGVASTISVDRDSERMSEKALQDMQQQILSGGVNLFGNHEHGWENTLGIIKKAELNNNQLGIKIFLDNPKTNPKIEMLLEKLKRGINLGLSVGGAVTKERDEYNKEAGKKVKVIDGVRLYEISVVGIPSNADAFLSLPQAISKCLHSKEKCPCCFSGMKDSICGVCLYKKT